MSYVRYYENVFNGYRVVDKQMDWQIQRHKTNTLNTKKYKHMLPSGVLQVMKKVLPIGEVALMRCRKN